MLRAPSRALARLRRVAALCRSRAVVACADTRAAVDHSDHRSSHWTVAALIENGVGSSVGSLLNLATFRAGSGFRVDTTKLRKFKEPATNQKSNHDTDNGRFPHLSTPRATAESLCLGLLRLAERHVGLYGPCQTRRILCSGPALRFVGVRVSFEATAEDDFMSQRLGAGLRIVI
jgi:hypothetical protein